VQITFVIFIAIAFSVFAMLLFVAAAFMGILLLETINYVEHYGLRRKLTDNGNYERVMPWHSWNSNHYIGRICLYELTRHSDHHYLASRKYQVLRHLNDAPQLPAGYPAMMLLSLLPPVWFYVMNRRAQAVMEAHE
jgi:alkane 1-monooxygenase